MVGSTAACSTHSNQHGTPSTGVRGNVDVDVLGVGVDAGAHLGVHTTGVGVPVRGVHAGQGGGRIPCAPSHNAMRASEGLIGWATAGGKGIARRSAQANAHDSGGYAGYNCSATNSGSSVLVNGEVVGQTNDRPWLSQGQEYRQEHRR